MLAGVFAVICCKRPRKAGSDSAPPTKRLVRAWPSISPSNMLLTENEQREVEQAWAHPNPSVVVRDYEGTRLTVQSLLTLRPGSWVNDEVINSYSVLLSSRHPQVLIHNTYFYTLLKLRKTHQTLDLNEIDRIYKRKGVRSRQIASFFARDQVLLPINSHGAHWACYCVDHRRQALVVYDSVQAEVDSTVLDYLSAELVRAKSPLTAYPVERVQCTQQENFYDCGAFLLLNLRNCVVSPALSVSQSQIPQARSLLAWELIHATLKPQDSSS